MTLATSNVVCGVCKTTFSPRLLGLVHIACRLCYLPMRGHRKCRDALIEAMRRHEQSEHNLVVGGPRPGAKSRA